MPACLPLPFMNSTLSMVDWTCLDQFHLNHVAIQGLCKIGLVFQEQVPIPCVNPTMQKVLFSISSTQDPSRGLLLSSWRFPHHQPVAACTPSWKPCLLAYVKADLAPIGAGLIAVVHFLNLVGAIDFIHIVLTVTHEEPQVHSNHHYFNRVNIQASFDHKSIFTDFVAKFPGSMHNLQNFATSGLNCLLTILPVSKGWLLGEFGDMTWRGGGFLLYLLMLYPKDYPPDCTSYSLAH